LRRGRASAANNRHERLVRFAHSCHWVWLVRLVGWVCGLLLLLLLPLLLRLWNCIHRLLLLWLLCRPWDGGDCWLWLLCCLIGWVRNSSDGLHLLLLLLGGVSNRVGHCCNRLLLLVWVGERRGCCCLLAGPRSCGCTWGCWLDHVTPVTTHDIA
jgi:hypothetical protein